jgi:hypothetical protein
VPIPGRFANEKAAETGIGYQVLEVRPKDGRSCDHVAARHGYVIAVRGHRDMPCEQVAVGVERSYNNLERSRNMVSVATQVAKLRPESERLATDQAELGVVLVSDVRHASAATYKANADLLEASLGYLLAHAELERTVARAPGHGTP